MSLEMGSWIAFEAAITIEGLAFDVFGKSELLARQASSTLWQAGSLGYLQFGTRESISAGGFRFEAVPTWSPCTNHGLGQLEEIS